MTSQEKHDTIISSVFKHIIMKPIVFGFVMAILIGCLCIGSVSAVSGPPYVTSGDQSIGATVPPHTVTITAPDAVPNWPLARGIVNEKNVGPVYISTTRPEPFQMTLSITGNLGGSPGWEFTQPLYATTDETPGEGTTWHNLKTGGVLSAGPFNAQLTPLPIQVWLRQEVVGNDVDGLRSLVLTYTLSVDTPAPTPTPTPTPA